MSRVKDPNRFRLWCRRLQTGPCRRPQRYRRLLRNVFWWYLLPIQVGLGALICSVVWQLRHAGLAVILGLMGYALVCGLLCWGVYKLNQYAVRKTLEPRRQELETLLSSLN